MIQVGYLANYDYNKAKFLVSNKEVKIISVKLYSIYEYKESFNTDQGSIINILMNNLEDIVKLNEQ
jgi:hypothetical protein